VRRVTRLLAATGILAAIAAPIVLSTSAQARVGGFHGGMGFHGGFHGGFHHGFFPRFGIGFGLGTLYGAYGWSGYSYYANPDYDYPSYPYYPSYEYPYPYPYYGTGYPTPAPYAFRYGGGYSTPALGFTVEPNLPPPEIKPPAPQAPSLVQRPPKQASLDNAVDPRLPDVRLTGIAIDRDRRIAIFAVTGTRPLLLSEGETLKDWRLDSISPQKVSLSGPAGTITLELFSPGPLPG
jgi:hypothetical protein